MTLIIGFGHKARHGKDEAVKAILADCASVRDARKYSFADALKREVTDAVRAIGGMENLFAMGLPWLHATQDAPPVPDWVQYDPNADMTDPLCPYGKQRTLLQWWGTEFRRAQDPYYWVEKTMARIFEENPEVALISDVRFPNEVNGIRINGGYIVRVDRIGYVTDVPEHVSEKALDGMSEMDWDYVIKAPEGGLDVLREEATNAFNFLAAVKLSAAPKPTLDELLEMARNYVMTPEEKRAQRDSWVRGEMALAEHERGMTTMLPHANQTKTTNAN